MGVGVRSSNDIYDPIRQVGWQHWVSRKIVDEWWSPYARTQNIIIIIVTAVKTYNLTWFEVVVLRKDCRSEVLEWKGFLLFLVFINKSSLVKAE
jgi:hypothetical protein